MATTNEEKEVITGYVDRIVKNMVPGTILTTKVIQNILGYSAKEGSMIGQHLARMAGTGVGEDSIVNLARLYLYRETGGVNYIVIRERKKGFGAYGAPIWGQYKYPFFDEKMNGLRLSQVYGCNPSPVVEEHYRRIVGLDPSTPVNI